MKVEPMRRRWWLSLPGASLITDTHLELFLVVRTGRNLWIQWAGAMEAAKWPVIHRPDLL